jgi:hypothetical protein
MKTYAQHGKEVQQLRAANSRHDNICIWNTNLYRYNGFSLFIEQVEMNMLRPVEYIESDRLIEYSTTALCLYGGLFIYDIHHDKPYKVLHWCSQGKNTLPVFEFDGGSNRILSIVFISYPRYSTGMILAEMKMTFTACISLFETFILSENLQQYVDYVYSSDHRGIGYNEHQRSIQRITNCLSLVYVVGENKVLSSRSNAYNISFTIPSAIGPTHIYISYLVHPYYHHPHHEPHHLDIQVETGHIFHFDSQASYDRHVHTPGHKHLSLFNVLKFSAFQNYHIDAGLTYMIAIVFRTNIFCSSAYLILKYKLINYFFVQQVPYDSLMIGQTKTNEDCSEILLHRFVIDQYTTHVTKVFIKVANTNVQTVVTISNPQISLFSKNCQVHESIILYECHHKMDIVYRYTFTNTSTHAVTWTSIFSSDIYLHITKTSKPSNDPCDGYVKQISVTYVKQVALYALLPGEEGKLY